MSTNTKPFIQYHNKKNSTVSTLNIQDTTRDNDYNLPENGGTLVTEEDVHKFASMIEIPLLEVAANEGYLKGSPYQRGMFFLEPMEKSVWEFSLTEDFNTIYHREELTVGNKEHLFFPKYVAENATNTIYVRVKYVSEHMQSGWSKTLTLDMPTIRVLGSNIFLVGKPVITLNEDNGGLVGSEFEPRNNYTGTLTTSEWQFSTETIPPDKAKPEFKIDVVTQNLTGNTNNVPEDMLMSNKDIYIRVRYKSVLFGVEEVSPYSDFIKIPVDKFAEYIAKWKKILLPSLSFSNETGVLTSTGYSTMQGFEEPLKEYQWEFSADKNFNPLIKKITNQSVTLVLPDDIMANDTDVCIRVKHRSETEESLYSNIISIPRATISELKITLKKIKTPTLTFENSTGQFNVTEYITREGFEEPVTGIGWEFATDEAFGNVVSTFINNNNDMYLPDDIATKVTSIYARVKYKSESEESLYSNVVTFTSQQLAQLLLTLKKIVTPKLTFNNETGVYTSNEYSVRNEYTGSLTNVVWEFSNDSNFSTKLLVKNNRQYRLDIPGEVISSKQDVYARIKHVSESEESLYSNVVSLTASTLSDLAIKLKFLVTPSLEIDKNTGVIELTQPGYRRSFDEPVTKVQFDYANDINFSNIIATEVIGIDVVSDILINNGDNGDNKYTSPVKYEITSQPNDIYVRAKYSSEYIKVTVADYK